MDKSHQEHGDQNFETTRRKVALGLLTALGGSLVLKGCGEAAARSADELSTDHPDVDGIASALTGTTAVRWFDKMEGTASDPGLADTTGSPSEVALLLGYYEPGDGGGGLFVWGASTLWNQTAAIDDRGTIINPAARRNPDPSVSPPAAAAGWRRLRVSKELNVRWFGAKGHPAVDDRNAIQSAINAMTGEISELYFPAGQYHLHSDLVIGTASPPGWGLSFRGEAAGINNDLWPALIWSGSEHTDTALVHVIGFDHRFETLRFDGRGVGHSQSTCKRAGVAVGGSGPYASGASNIQFTRCQFIGFEIGCGLSLDGTITSNLEQCSWIDCLFGCYETGLWIRRGQPYNTSIIRPVFGAFAPPWQPRGTGPDGGPNPYGIGIRIGDDGNNTSGTTFIDTPNFSYVCIGVLSDGMPANLVIRNIDSENMKRLLWCKGGLGYNCQIRIENGRFDLSAIGNERPGETYNHAYDIPGTDASYIKMGSGNLVVEGCGFAPNGPNSYKFKIETNGVGSIMSRGNYYPSLDPFLRTGSWIFDGTQAWYGGTWSEGDIAECRSPSTGAFVPDAQVPSNTYSLMPTLRGCENGDGFVDIVDTNTFADVVFSKVELRNKPFADGQAVNYRVHLTIQQTTAGATVGTPYVTGPLITGFRVNVTSAPGSGQKIRVAWAISRGFNPLSTLT